MRKTPFRLRSRSGASWSRSFLLVVASLGASIAATPAHLARAADRPNVVLIMADDFGYECVGAYGSTSYKTPNLDKLAATGIRFDRAYSQPLCTPTRAQLMTGLYNVRNYTRFGHLDPSQTTFANLFRDAGYATGIVGKWQLGQGFDLPRHFGFDAYCLWQLNRRPPRYANPGLESDGKEVDYAMGEYGPDLVNDYALDFIGKHKDEPFLLYYPMILTHAPFQPTPASPNWDPKAVGESVHNDPENFPAMVAYTDKVVGELVETLERHGLREKTLILFLGDNGTGTAITSMLGDRAVRGGKGKTTDNGFHVPLIANWPGAIAPGGVSGDLVDSTDFLPTICEAAGVAIPSSLEPDGRSFLPRLRGDSANPRDWIYCWYARDGGASADPDKEFAMDARFKLYRDGRLFEYPQDLDEHHPLATDALDGPAAAAHRSLRKALDKYEDVRPAKLAAEAGQPDPAAKKKKARDRDAD